MSALQDGLGHDPSVTRTSPQHLTFVGKNPLSKSCHRNKKPSQFSEFFCIFITGFKNWGNFSGSLRESSKEFFKEEFAKFFQGIFRERIRESCPENSSRKEFRNFFPWRISGNSRNFPGKKKRKLSRDLF